MNKSLYEHSSVNASSGWNNGSKAAIENVCLLKIFGGVFKITDQFLFWKYLYINA